MDGSKKIGRIRQLNPGKDVDYRQLVALLGDSDEEVRYWAIERVGAVQTRETVDLLVGALADPAELVRVQCLEELSCRGDLTEADAAAIRPYLNDESESVRRYAAAALAAARDRSIISLLRDRLASASTAEQSSYCFALAALGDGSALDQALELLEAKGHHTRCSVANGIIKFVDDSNRERIVGALKKAWERETTTAAKSSIEAALKELGE
jgi:HEAT repeat protein